MHTLPPAPEPADDDLQPEPEADTYWVYEQGSLTNFRKMLLCQLEDAAVNYFFPVDDGTRSQRDADAAA